MREAVKRRKTVGGYERKRQLNQRQYYEKSGRNTPKRVLPDFLLQKAAELLVIWRRKGRDKD